MRTLAVHLTPALVSTDDFEAGIAVAIDILRATTTIVHALAAGADAVIATAEIDEATALAASVPPGTHLLAGERGGAPIPGFDLGNSPREFTSTKCAGRSIIFTTTNGTRAILHASRARRILIGAFTNFSAVCEELLAATEDVHLLCAGTEGSPALEDTLFAGAVVKVLVERGAFELTDAARIAWDTFEGHGQVLRSAFELATGGRNLAKIGLAGDLPWAARIDRFGIVPEARGNPPRIEIHSQHWQANHLH